MAKGDTNITPAQYLRKLLDEYKKEFPDDPINKPLQSDFWESDYFKDLIKPYNGSTRRK